MVKKRRKRSKRKSLRKRIRKYSPKGKPLIGITCEVHKLKPYFSEFELSCDYRYVRAVMRAGGVPVLLPINPIDKDVNQILDTIDGLIITGGADIHPSFYGEKSKEKVKPIYRGRTYFEMHLYRAAQRRKIPVLGICHGLQLLNVIHGGKLYQDIQTELKGVKSHQGSRNHLHRVEVQPGSLYHKIFGKKSFYVHSEHHQAVKVPGKNFQITVFAEDGVPEAIEGPERTLAVQWHPERQAKDPIQTRLFKYFLNLARQSKKTG